MLIDEFHAFGEKMNAEVKGLRSSSKKPSDTEDIRLLGQDTYYEGRGVTGIISHKTQRDHLWSRYSVSKLFTGLALAAFAACTQMVTSANAMIIAPPPTNITADNVMR